MGFEGINPCGQTHGAEKLYPSGQTPTEILLSGNYTQVKNYVKKNIPLGTGPVDYLSQLI